MWACDPNITSTILASYEVAGPLFAQTLQAFFAAQCALVGDHLWPADATQAVLEDPNYDFVVVGAGSAGSVVANRLSEISDWKILLVEAGGNPTLATEMPQLFYSNIATKQDWGYRIQPQAGSCRSYKSKGCAWPRGKTLGGCSSINAMFYVRGNKADYDEWAKLGNDGWSYEDVLPFFKKSENFNMTMDKETSKYHGTGGYLNVEDNDDIHIFEDLIIKAVKELGIPQINDVNGDSQIGVQRSHTTTKKGIRASTARAFLTPVKERKNLHVLKNTLASKILFKPNSNEVSGILLNKDGRELTVNIKKELIVSAGAINSPQLLLLSGIGPEKHLKELDIEVKADLPVGENLQDHVFVPSYYTLPGHRNYTSLPNIISAFTDYVINNKGPLSDTSPHKVISFFNTKDKSSSIPDTEYHYIVFPPSLYNLLDIYGKHGLSQEFHQKFNEINTDNFIIGTMNVLLRPRSKGKIMLKSKDPKDYPLIYANYFEDPEDMETVLQGMKEHGLKLGDTKAFKDAGAKLIQLDLEACKNFVRNSDEFLDCIAREVTFSLYHPVGTCKMGPDEDPSAVLHPNLKVKKIKGLRVIDASIMPTIVRGNTNAPVIMIGEKGADLIKRDWLNVHSEL